MEDAGDVGSQSSHGLGTISGDVGDVDLLTSQVVTNSTDLDWIPVLTHTSYKLKMND